MEMTATQRFEVDNNMMGRRVEHTNVYVAYWYDVGTCASESESTAPDSCETANEYVM